MAEGGPWGRMGQMKETPAQCSLVPRIARTIFQFFGRGGDSSLNDCYWLGADIPIVRAWTRTAELDAYDLAIDLSR